MSTSLAFLLAFFGPSLAFLAAAIVRGEYLEARDRRWAAQHRRAVAAPAVADLHRIRQRQS